MRPACAASKPRGDASSACRSASTRRTGSASASARAVGATPAAVRTNRRSLKTSRKRASSALVAGWLRCNRVAARDTLRSRINASKPRSSAMSSERISAMQIL